MTRPPAWNKIVAIRELLKSFDTVVWVDADAFVVDVEQNILSAASLDRFIWLTRHHYNGEDQPNTGVMVVHAGDESERFLEAAWDVKQLVEHPWWEQAAILHLLGFDVTNIGHARLVAPTAWLNRVGWLDNRWNSIPLDCNPQPIIKHYPAMSNGERVASMTQDLRRFLGVAAKAKSDTSTSIIVPLREGSAETHLISLLSIAESSAQKCEFIIVDDGAHLRGVVAAISGNVKIVDHDRRYGLAAAWNSGLQAATGDVVIFLKDAVRLWRGAIEALHSELDLGAVAATATSDNDALLPSFRSSVIAARRQDVLEVGVPFSAQDQDAVGELCTRLGRKGMPVSRVASAAYSGPAPISAPDSIETGLADWALGILRSTYRDSVESVATRQELPRLLEARGLNGVGAEVGVQEGLFSRYILTYWGGKKLLSIDAWEYFSPDEYIDIANASQDQQDRLYQATCERLSVFGERSQIIRSRSVEAAMQVADASLDFVYLDAGHSYEAVMEDLKAWSLKVKPGGIISGHDYLDGDLPEGNFGVKRAVDEFFAARGATVGATTMDPPWRSWIVTVPQNGWPDLDRSFRETAGILAASRVALPAVASGR